MLQDLSSLIFFFKNLTICMGIIFIKQDLKPCIFFVLTQGGTSFVDLLCFLFCLVFAMSLCASV